LVEEAFIPAIREVGAKYERREYFLPQLVSAAETMEIGMQELGPRLATTGAGRKATGVIATVKGDVHDIGKKIVAMMLRNSGYRIIDLGKSVSAEAIVEAARQEQAELILLSALMTTTMCEMEEVVRQVRANGLKAKVMVGGAVVTAAFAQQIGADGYSADAHAAVTKAEELIGTLRPEQPHA
jgi:5-methyltetrahydrofolate--homocysteine methyltransferase